MPDQSSTSSAYPLSMAVSFDVYTYSRMHEDCETFLDKFMNRRFNETVYKKCILHSSKNVRGKLFYESGIL